MNTLAKEFTSAADLRAHYRAVLARNRPKPVKRPPQHLIYASPIGPELGELSRIRSQAQFRTRDILQVASTSIQIERRTIPLREILHEVCEVGKIGQTEIQGNRRSRSIVWWRHAFIYLACTLTRQSTVQIAMFLNRDHSTVCHGRDMVKRKWPEFEMSIFAIRVRLGLPGVEA